jgi:hypothetical protein
MKFSLLESFGAPTAFVVGALLFGGCSGSGEEATGSGAGENVCSRTLAIHGGQSAGELGVTAEVAAAIGLLRVFDEDGAERGTCSATRVSERWALTARHCVEAPAFPGWLSFTESHELGGDSCDGREQTAIEDAFTRHDIERIELHPRLDIAAVKLAPSGAGPWLEVVGATPELGDDLVLAGFGRTEAGTEGERLFVKSRLAGMPEGHLLTDSGDEAGACTGDSGGPALLEVDGTWQIAGTLARGSQTCRGEDEYVDLSSDELRTWLEQATGS